MVEVVWCDVVPVCRQTEAGKGHIADNCGHGPYKVKWNKMFMT